MNSGQNPLLKKKDLSFTETSLENTYSFYKKLYTEMKMRRSDHIARYNSNVSFLLY